MASILIINFPLRFYIFQQNQLTRKEIEDLLKKGAYGAVMDDENDGDKFCEEDIDQILKQRTQVIQLEQGEKGSTFSKVGQNC
jgi:chromodomain-helicase-DNA-binding protein 7